MNEVLFLSKRIVWPFRNEWTNKSYAPREHTATLHLYASPTVKLPPQGASLPRKYRILYYHSTPEESSFIRRPFPVPTFLAFAPPSFVLVLYSSFVFSRRRPGVLHCIALFFPEIKFLGNFLVRPPLCGTRWCTFSPPFWDIRAYPHKVSYADLRR